MYIPIVAFRGHSRPSRLNLFKVCFHCFRGGWRLGLSRKACRMFKARPMSSNANAEGKRKEQKQQGALLKKHDFVQWKCNAPDSYRNCRGYAWEQSFATSDTACHGLKIIHGAPVKHRGPAAVALVSGSLEPPSRRGCEGAPKQFACRRGSFQVGRPSWWKRVSRLSVVGFWHPNHP